MRPEIALHCLPSVTEMVSHLDQFVRGQIRAKRDLAVAVYNHYMGLAGREHARHDLGRYHTLLIGPTGCGKSYMVQLLADLLGVPVAFASAASLVESGYRGRSVDDLVRSLLLKAKDDPARAERGIIFLDEIDKIRRINSGSRDISGEGVQNALLTMLDGRLAEQADGQRHKPVHTSNVLFIATGAFVGLDKIVEARVGSDRDSIGFKRRPQEDSERFPDHPTYRWLVQAQTADLVEFGMIPEFIGRFATVTVLHELGRKELRDILSESTKASPLNRQVDMAALHGIRLRLSEDVIDWIVDRAVALGTGTRALHRLVGEAVDSVDYRWAELASDGVTQVEIDRACAEGHGEPRLVRGTRETPRLDESLRKSVFESFDPLAQLVRLVLPKKDPGDQPPKGESQALLAVSRLLSGPMAYEDATEEAKETWSRLVRGHRQDPASILSLVEDLVRLRATLQEFADAALAARTEDLTACVHYMLYLRRRDVNEKKS